MTRNQKTTRRVLCVEPLEDRCLLSVGYTLVDLGGLPGLSYQQSNALSINEAGDIVGDSYTSGPGGPMPHAVVWHRDANGTYRITDLDPSTTVWSNAFDINSQGEVVGRTGTPDGAAYIFLVRPEDTDSDGRPDRWYRDNDGDGLNDLMISLTALNEAVGAVGSRAINDPGQIIGFAGLAQFDGSGNLGFNSEVSGQAISNQDINNNAWIVGGGNLWQVDSAGQVVSGPTALGLADPSRPESINTSGSAVVGGRQLWQAGVITNLGTLGGSDTLAWAVNDSVQVVGRSALKSKATQAFVWQDGTMTNLNNFLPRKSGWLLGEATGISNAGWIVGTGRVSIGKSSESHGFLMIPVNNLAAAKQATGGAAYVSLSPQQVQPLLAEALFRWQAAGVNVSSLHGIDFRIADLGGTTLGLASGNTIWLDDNAAGWGWFVDPTPWEDSEFTTPGNQGEQGKMDLLTALAHEIGHLLGQDHADEGVMAETLLAGTRRMPLAFTDTDWLAAVDVLFAKKFRD